LAATARRGVDAELAQVVETSFRRRAALGAIGELGDPPPSSPLNGIFADDSFWWHFFGICRLAMHDRS
jgi:hypothetical protein